MSGNIPTRLPYRRARGLARSAALLAAIMLASGPPTAATALATASSPTPIQLTLPAPTGHHRAGRRPVVLYSHGLGGERTETTALVEDLASHGYIVVTIDHIHDARAVELPDGRVLATAIPELTEDNELQLTTKAIDARVVDTSFVLDQLAATKRGDNPDAEHRPLPRGLRGALDLNHIGMFGHSDGGATTAAALHADPRITAGVNLDGTLWTPDAMAGSNRPLNAARNSN